MELRSRPTSNANLGGDAPRHPALDRTRGVTDAGELPRDETVTRCGDALNPKAAVDPAETATTLKGDTDEVVALYEDERGPTVRRSPTLPNE